MAKRKAHAYRTGGPTGWWDKIQTGLTAGGMTPGWGLVPDVLNTGISAVRSGYNYAIGDDEAGKKHLVNTGVNATTAIPIFGQGVATTKLAAALLPAVIKTTKKAAVKKTKRCTKSYKKYR